MSESELMGTELFRRGQGRLSPCRGHGPHRRARWGADFRPGKRLLGLLAATRFLV